MDDTRQYLVNQAVAAECDETMMLAHALLVLHDAGLLESPGEDDAGAPLFKMNEGATDEQLEAAQVAFHALNECDDDAWSAYLAMDLN